VRRVRDDREGAAMKLTAANAEIRAQNVTASEVGALMGPHPYTTPEAIWDRLCSPFALEVVQTESMDTGSCMESSILRLAERRLGFKARQNSRTFVHKRVRLAATPDAFVIGDPPLPNLPPGLVEIKFGQPFGPWKTLPPYVEWQARAQMSCTNRESVLVAVLVNVRLQPFFVERDRAEEDRMLERVDRFWRDHIVTGIRPEPAAPEEMVLNFRTG
jgi:hypothetical protein